MFTFVQFKLLKIVFLNKIMEHFGILIFLLNDFISHY